MRTTNFKLKPALLILLAVALLGYACSRVEDNTRAGSLLVVENIIGFNGGDETEETPLLSDMCESAPPGCDQCGVVNDNANVTFSNEFLQIGPGSGVGSGSFLNDIIVTRYRVDYFRPNNRNTPGVDVPFGVDGTMNVRVPLNGTAGASIVIVRHISKTEPPLSDLVQLGPFEGVITTQSEIKFFGQDVSGRTVSALGFLEIHFANFADEGC
ncbi:MAG TPA: hypothetical protein VLH08_13335 [Acidobacteriota bacterium]|nr:hypothetical protein [Acidobacteriota bacterium]